MTAEEFRKGWDLMVSAFPSHNTTKETYLTWFKLLEPMPFVRFIDGIKDVLATHKYSTFPTPAEVLVGLEKDSTFRGTPAQKLESYRSHKKRPLLEEKPEPPPLGREEGARRFEVVMRRLRGEITTEEGLEELKRISETEKEHSND